VNQEESEQNGFKLGKSLIHKLTACILVFMSFISTNVLADGMALVAHVA